ncbi:Ig-like domain-containing protein, partial [Candidatus Pyrohabitans sp.]
NVYWYLNVTVVNSTGAPLGNANITVYNSSNITVFSGTTGASGNLRLALREFFKNSTAEVYESPYIVKASKFGYISNETSVNLNRSMNVILSMERDTYPPEVGIHYPANTTYSTSNVAINISAADPSGVSTVIAEIDGTANVTLTPSGGYYTGATPALSDGQHSLRVYASDSYGNLNSSEVIYFSVDTTPPAVTFVAPTPANNTLQNYSYVYVNITATEALSKAWVEVWTGALTQNYSLNGSAKNWYGNLTNLQDGVYHFRVWANDTAGNINKTEAIILRVDATPPVIALSIANGSYIEESKGVNITLTSNENLSGAWISISGAKNLVANLSGSGRSWHSNLSLPQGGYSLVAHAVDAAGNENTALVSFYVVSLSGQNATNITANTTGAIINTPDVVIEANATANTTLNLSVAVASFSIGARDLNRTTSLGKADRCVKYVEIRNNTAVQNVSRIRIEMHFTKAEIGNLDPGTLALFYWNGTAWISTQEYINKTIPDSRGGLHVYDAGRVYSPSTGKGYVYAEVNHTSHWAVAGRIKQAALVAPSPGVYSPEAVLLANSIDLALAQELVAHLKERGIKLYVVSAANFTDYTTKRYIIILGGHRAYEGVGDILAGILSEEEKARIEAGRAYIKKRSVFRSGDVVYIFAGKDRNATRGAWQEAYEEVVREIEYNWG